MAQQYTTPGSAPPLGEQAGATAESVKDAAGQVKEAAGQAVGQAQRAAGEVVGQAKEQATSQVVVQKDRAAGSLGMVAEAIRQTGRGLRDQDQATAGRYADTVAEQVERVAAYLREADVADLLSDAEAVARRQPGLFLGGAVALGFLGTRFLMSSGSRAERRQRALASAGSRAGAPAGPARRSAAGPIEASRPDGNGTPLATSAAVSPGPVATPAGRAAPAPGALGATGAITGAGSISPTSPPAAPRTAPPTETEDV